MRKYDGHVLDARNQWANLMSTSKRPFINDVILRRRERGYPVKILLKEKILFDPTNERIVTA